MGSTVNTATEGGYQDIHYIHHIMRTLSTLLSGCLLLHVHSRPQKAQMEGFNLGQNSGQSGSGSGYNAGSEDSVNFPENIEGDSGYNAGSHSQQEGNSGFNPGRNGDSGFNSGSGSNGQNGNSGFNPGRNGESGFNGGSEGNQQDGNSGFNPGRNGDSGFNAGKPGGVPPGSTGFRTPIIFAEDNELEDVRVTPDSPLPPYQPGGDKRPYLRGQGDENSGPSPPCAGCSQAAEVDKNIVAFALSELNYGDCQKININVENFEKQVVAGLLYKFDLTPSGGCGESDASLTTCHMEVYSVPWRNTMEVLWEKTTCSQQSSFVPLLQTSPNNFISAQTLPSQIQFAGAPTQPYTPGQNKQQYLRGRQQQQLTQDQDQYLPLISGQVAVQGVQTLPSPIVWAPREQAPYVPGTNKQQYLRGAPEEGVQYVPLIQVRGQPPNIGVQTLPSPITFAEDPAQPLPPYVPGSNKQQYLRGVPQTKPVQEQPQFVPLLKINGNIPVQTLPSPITFAEDPAQSLPPYVPGSNKQQHLRGVPQTKPALRPQTRPVFPQFAPLVQVRGGNTAAQPLPSPTTFAAVPAPTQALAPYVPGSNKQQYVRGPAGEDTQFVPLIQVGDNTPVQTLPSPINFAEDPASVSTIQQYLSYVRGQTGPSPQTSSSAQSGDSGVSARPSFPPGYYPGLARRAPAYEGQAPKNVLYFF